MKKHNKKLYENARLKMVLNGDFEEKLIELLKGLTDIEVEYILKESQPTIDGLMKEKEYYDDFKLSLSDLHEEYFWMLLEESNEVKATIRSLEESYYLDHQAMLRILETNNEELIKQGIEEDDIIEFVEKEALKKLETEGCSIFKSNSNELYAYKLEK